MCPGEWEGKRIFEGNKTLILGESHYGDENQSDESIGKPVPYDTSGVVQYYIDCKQPGVTCDRWTRFFDKIANCFGYPKGEEAHFFDKVWFGNYVPVLCGKSGDESAKVFMKENRSQYNGELFEFINKKGIDTVFCFSKETFWNLPKASEQEWKSYVEYELGQIGKGRNTMLYFQYLPGAHECCNVDLKKPLVVYGIRHPSAMCGFRADVVYKELSKRQELKDLFYTPELSER